MTSLPFAVSLELALGGKGAVAKADYDAALAATAPHLDWLRKARTDKSLELLGVPSRTDDIEAAQKVADTFCKDTTDIAVLGIGGSSLGGQALKAALESHDREGPRVTFHDNPDPFAWKEYLSKVDLKTTRFVAISKSGGTAETLMQALTAADLFDKAGAAKYLKHHFVMITEPGDNVLRKFAASIEAPVLDHPRDVGGRYSVLTMCGAFPSILMGIDIKALRRRRAGLSRLRAVRRAARMRARCGAALRAGEGRTPRSDGAVGLCRPARHVPCVVAAALGRKPWQGRQGLDAGGRARSRRSAQPAAIVPRRAGQVALHDPLDRHEGRGSRRAARTRRRRWASTISQARQMGDLVDAEARATAQTLSRNGRPVRTIHLPKIDERSIGALMMHFMLETILMGRLMGVDPFDQPGVEEGKVLAREYLQNE